MTKVKRRRLEITTETYLKITFRSESEIKVYCHFCKAIVKGLSIDQMPEKFNRSLNKINEFDSKEQIHFAEDKEIICSNSFKNHSVNFD